MLESGHPASAGPSDHQAPWRFRTVGRYRDLPLGTVDASVIATAERFGIQQVATVDRRHFSIVRPRHTAAFELLP